MHVEGVLANNDYILNGCYIEITSNCNLRCIHCYNESGELRDQISVEAFKNVLGCYDNPKKASITLSGGEPLLHPQVWKFIDMMLESGILARNILLITNATCITDDVANMLAEKHVSVQVSLNGSRAELHDSICGKGNFERTMAGLQRLLSKHANMVIVRNMMNKQNMNDNWDMFCEKLIDMGVHKIMLAGLKKVGRANENLEKIALTPLEYQSLIDRLKESKVITGINDEYRKLAGDEAESNIRIDIPVPYSCLLYTSFRMVCRNFILPEFCKPCLFLFSSQFAKLIVHYLQTVADLCTDRRLFGAPLSGFSDPWGHARCQWANCFVDGKPVADSNLRQPSD